MKISREKSEGENKQTNREEKQLKAIRKRKKIDLASKEERH
jgi:hypothetical protein